MVTGLLAASALALVPSQPSLRLLADVAASWERLADDVLAHYGWRPTLTDAYRSYAEQVRIFRERYTSTPIAGRPTKVWGGVVYYLRPGMATAAVPGTSNHGSGDTVDVRGLGRLGDFSSASYADFARLAQAHGWSNKEGRKIGEPWHWQRFAEQDQHTGETAIPPTPTTPTVPFEEDDMKDTIIATYLRTVCAMPAPSEVAYWLTEIAAGRQSIASLEAALKSDARYAQAAALGSETARNAARNAAGAGWVA